jgi:hypothetical protein
VRTRAIFEDLELNLDPRERAGNLTVAKMQMMEIAKAVSYNSELLIMDEPTSSLTETEIAQLLQDHPASSVPGRGDHLTSPTRWKRSFASATRSRSFGTASSWGSGTWLPSPSRNSSVDGGTGTHEPFPQAGRPSR